MSFVANSKLFRNSIFRLSLLYTLLFALSVVVLFGYIYWATAGYMVRQTEATIEAETDGLVEHYRQSGLTGLYDVIRDRLSREATSQDIYLLTDKNFKPLLGNLDKWPQGEVSETGWLMFRLPPDRSRDGERYQARARVFLLQNRYYLLVGQDTHQLEKMQQLIRDAMIWGLLITLLLAMGGGVMMSKAMMHRIEAINNTCHRIIDGDLSQRIRTTGGDDDIDKLIQTLNRMLDQIELLMQGIKQVTDNIAHDLRTPLSRLRRRLDMLRIGGLPDGEQEELIDQTIAEADGLLTAFKALLRISEIEAGSRRANFAPLDVTALLDDLIELYEPLAQEKGQSLVWGKMPTRALSGDRDLLFQAFSNILDNAIKYTPDAGHIELALEDRQDALEVIVRDNGPGIPQALREKVVERFFRLESNRSSPGNGLGLSLVAAIVKLHHGTLTLNDNHPGLLLRIQLPRQS
ncbi:MAG: two-component sensor histidine kinase [Desulfuromonas sp.]|nr:MAG: two-component sensor histidine kinase [Desulfuromonas sp.]